MKHIFAALWITVIALGLVKSGLAQPANTNSTAGTGPDTNAVPAEATLDLAQSQLNAIKIETVGTYRFPVEKETVGSVSFDEDPAIVQAESTLLGAAATAELTGKELDRATSLGVTNGISPKELEQATSDQQTAAAALKAARDALRALGKTDDEIDQVIAAGKIGSTPGSTEWVMANVPESDGPLFRVGQTATVSVLAFPDRKFDGKVSKIYATIDPNTHRQTLRCEMDDPDHELRPGMLATVVIQIQDPVAAVAIPVNGVVREGDGTMTVWVTADSRRFTQRIVKTGLRENGWVQILDGLKPGELAVTDGAIYLDNILQAPPSD